uniref:Uncharacterized protein n=1 Tax=Anguilla anguilla TaxID=7936 RepID=A0A0E9R4D2_ANGAN
MAGPAYQWCNFITDICVCKAGAAVAVQAKKGQCKYFPNIINSLHKETDQPSNLHTRVKQIAEFLPT